jgi:hypothetical protein
LLYDKSVYNDSQGKVVVTTNKDFNCFLYGAYASVGYNDQCLCLLLKFIFLNQQN